MKVCLAEENVTITKYHNIITFQNMVVYPIFLIYYYFERLKKQKIIKEAANAIQYFFRYEKTPPAL